MDRVPLVDLKAQYEGIAAELDVALANVVASTAFVGGPDLSAIEDEFAAYCEADGCVGVSSGTDALYLALRALDIGPGDEVITVSHTFVATAEAITMTGATPVFVDILPGTMLMDPPAAAAAVTPRTRALIPVHLYGQPCDMDRINAIAEENGLAVIEDAAQAHGARWNGRRVGALGTLGCFSFYPAKNLGAYGDGGAVVGKDPELLLKVRMLANHGRAQKYVHDFPGTNSRLDNLQAAILRVKLRHLDAWNAARREHAALYLERLEGLRYGCPVIDPAAESAWHLFVLRDKNRDKLVTGLKERGVGAGIHYPLAVHQQPAYADMVREGSLPATEAAAAEVFSLPMYAELTPTLQDKVISTLTELTPS